MKVIFVDDDHEILDSIQAFIELALDDIEAKFEFFSDGKTAIKWYQENKDVDLVVSDINMPEMNGIEMAKELRNLQMSCPIVFFSGHGDKAETHGIENSSLVNKPSVEQLMNEIRSNLKLS